MIQKSKFQIKTVLLFVALLFAQMSVFCKKVTYLRSSIDVLDNIAIAIFSVVFIANLFNNKIKVKKIIFASLLTAIGLVSYFATKNSTISYLAIMSFAFLQEDFSTVIKMDLLSKITILIFVSLNYELGYTDARIITRDGMIREALGFAHPNTLGYILVTIYIDFLYLYKNKKRFQPLLFLLLFTWLSIKAGSRTSIVMLFVLFIADSISNKGRLIKNQKLRVILVSILPILLLLITIILTRLYASENIFALRINELLSNRIKLQNYYMQTEAITLFGKEMDFADIPLDNGYFRILYNFGVVGLSIILLVCSVALKKTSKENENIQKVLILLCIYGLSEWIVFRAVITPYWLFVFTKSEKVIPNEKPQIA